MQFLPLTLIMIIIVSQIRERERSNNANVVPSENCNTKVSREMEIFRCVQDCVSQKGYNYKLWPNLPCNCGYQ